MLVTFSLCIFAVAAFVLLRFLYKRYLHSKKILSDLSLSGNNIIAAANLYTNDNFFVINKKEEGHTRTDSSVSEAEVLALEIEDIQWVLNKKKTELRQLKETRKLSNESTAKVDSIDSTICILEKRQEKLEKEITEFRTTAITLDEHAYNLQQVKNEQAQYIQQLHTTLSENESLRLEWESMQEELQETKRQKQQLLKKVKLLEELNREFAAFSKEL